MIGDAKAKKSYYRNRFVHSSHAPFIRAKGGGGSLIFVLLEIDNNGSSDTDILGNLYDFLSLHSIEERTPSITLNSSK